MIVRAFAGPLLVTFAIVLFILVMQFLWKYVDDLMGKGLAWHVVAELLTYATASFVPLALPLAVLLSSIMTMGGLGENSELVPMRSAGMGLYRIIAPMAMAVLAIAAFSFFFSNNLLPVAELKFRSLLWDVTQKKPAMNLQPGVFYNGIDGFSIRVMDKDAETGALDDVLIYDHRAPFQANRTVIRARTGTMQRSTDGQFMVLTLHDGHIYDEHGGMGDEPGRHRLTAGTFARDEIRFDLTGMGLARTDEDLFKDHYKMLTMGQLRVSMDSLRERYAARRTEQLAHLGGSLWPARPTPIATRPVLPAEPAPVAGPAAYDMAADLVRNQINFLDRTMEERRGRREQIDRFGIEMHRKPMLAFTCIVFFLIGAPLGAIIRRGGMGLPTVFAIGFFLVFHITSFSMEKLVVAGELAPWPGMWVGVLALLPVGLFLTWKAATDSPLLDRDAYHPLGDRLRSLLRRRRAGTSAG
ncbi:MAG: LptF/LptG family permease [Flavobacteriales bacterium]|nr:LptF/LptG family permease [Flavobacteriales bacterium]